MAVADNVRVDITASVEQAESALGRLKGTLTGLRDSLKGGIGLSTVASQISGVAGATNQLNVTGVQNLAKLAEALTNLKGASKLGLSKTNIDRLVDLGTVAELLAKVDVGNFTKLSESLGNFKGLKVSDSIAKQIEKIAESSQKLNGMDFTGLREMSNALQPLTTQLNSVNSEMRTTVDRLAQVSNASRSQGGGGRSFVNIFAGLKLAEQFIGGFTRKVAQAVTKANDYIEDYNLFTVSLGQYAERAEEYADRVSELMGIDPSKWMRNQGIFMTLATGFGVASDRAYIMSKNLVQLGYDLSSFFNIAVEGEGGSMQKLQAALSGELEPLRRLGFDLSEARLKAVALSLGIDQTFNSMTQAQKAQLRYYAILTQVTTAQGDMARTLNTPANQLRILKQQTEQAARAFGNIFIPVLNQLLPYANAVASALREIAEALAAFFGFEMPTVDYSDVVTNVDTTTESVDDLSGSLGKAGSNAKKLKNLLADWDELNIIHQENDTSSGGSGGSGKKAKTALNPDDWTFALPEYDFLKNYTASLSEQIKKGFGPTLTWIKNNIAGLVSLAEGVGESILLWKIASPFVADLQKTSKWAEKMSTAVLALSTATLTFFMDIQFTKDFLQNKNLLTLFTGAGTSLFGSAATGLIAAKSFGAKGGLAAAGGTLALTAAADLVLTIEDIKTNGKISSEDIATGALASLKAGLGVGLAVGGVTGNAVVGLVAGVITLGVTAGLSLVLANATVEEWRDRLDWGLVSLQADAIKKYVEKRFFDQNVTATINLLSVRLDERESAIKQLNTDVADVSAKLNSLTLTGEIRKDEPAIEALKNQITGEDGVIAKLSALLQKDQAAVQLAVAVAPLGDGENVDTANMLSSLRGADSVINSVSEGIGNQIAQMLEKGFKEGLDKSETEMLNALWGKLTRIQEAITTGQAGAEFTLAVSNLTDFSRETFGESLEEFQRRREELRAGIEKAIGTQYVSTMMREAALVRIMAEHSEMDKEYQAAQKELDAMRNSDWYKNLMDPKWRAQRVTDLTDQQAAAGDAAFRDAILERFGGAFKNLDWYKIGSMVSSQAPLMDGADSLLSTILTDIVDASNLGGNEKGILGKAIAANLVTMSDLIGPEGMTALSDMLKREISHSQNADAKGLMEQLLSSLFGISPGSGEKGTWFQELAHVFGENNIFPAPDLSQVESKLTEVERKVTSTVQKVRAQLQTLYSFTYSLGIRGGGDATYVPSTVANSAKLSFAMFAEGGLPDTGEMFIAREDGPEIIGQIGSRTAVANNDQIVTGITNGVAAAQTEQNRLLREQNAYLKVIAAKSGKAVFAPSVEMARVMRRSEEMRLQAEGV
jgi:hypothetical protein